MFFRFALIATYVDKVLSQTTVPGIHEALDSDFIARSNPRTYILHQVAGQSTPRSTLAKRAFGWLVVSSCELTVSQLLDVLSCTEASSTRTQTTSLATILRACGGLVTVDYESDSLKIDSGILVMDVIRAFGLSETKEWAFNERIRYLLSCPPLQSGPCTSIRELEVRLNAYPFLSYACSNLARSGVDFSVVNDEHNAQLVHRLISSHPIWYSYLQAQLHIPGGMGLQSMTLLHRAAFLGHDHSVRSLLNSESGTLDAIDSFDRTPLCQAVGNGHLSVVRTLLEAGACPSGRADEEIRTSPGGSPLHLAAGYGSVNIITKLLEFGADVEGPRLSFPFPPLREAIAENQVDAALFLIGYKAELCKNKWENDTTPLIDAASRGNETIVRGLLEAGARTTDQDQDGKTALAWASLEGHEAAVESLLRHGSAPDGFDRQYRTPLSWAAEMRHARVMEVLLDYGADPVLPDCWGSTPLSRSRFSSVCEMRRALWMLF